MYPDSEMFLILPLALYGGLALLPTRPGLAVSSVACAGAGVFALSSIGAPRHPNILLDHEFRVLFAGGLLGAAGGAVMFHRLMRTRRATLAWHAAGLGIALVLTALITVFLIASVL